MKKILVLNIFPTAYPPSSGGTLRYYHIYNELSRYYDITLLSQSRESRFVEYSPTFREYRIDRDPMYGTLKKELQLGHAKYERDLVVNLKLSEQSTIYKKAFDQLSIRSDLIIHESPYLLGYDRDIWADHRPRVYNSHNHEYALAREIWTNDQAKVYLPEVYTCEKKLIQLANVTFATSEMERENMIAMYGADPTKIKLAPNGIDLKDRLQNKRKKFNSKPTALFIGADFPPNLESAKYIIKRLADRCPDIQFVIAGGCCRPFHDIHKRNVQLLGRISHEDKKKQLEDADLAINPMFKGAGVNIKTLEFLSAGIPLFSTAFGVRGLELEDQIHYIRAEKDDFAEKLNQYSHQPKLLSKIARVGQRYIHEHYSWPQIAKRIKSELDPLLKN